MLPRTCTSRSTPTAAARATVAAFDSRALVKADRVDPVPPALLPRSGDLPLISTVLALAARLDAGSGEAPATNG